MTLTVTRTAAAVSQPAEGARPLRRPQAPVPSPERRARQGSGFGGANRPGPSAHANRTVWDRERPPRTCLGLLALTVPSPPGRYRWTGDQPPSDPRGGGQEKAAPLGQGLSTSTQECLGELWPSQVLLVPVTVVRESPVHQVRVTAPGAFSGH